jgi:hypothetical protein
MNKIECLHLQALPTPSHLAGIFKAVQQGKVIPHHGMLGLRSLTYAYILLITTTGRERKHII